MDMTEKQRYSLTRARCRKELHCAMSSLEEECPVDTQKCYSSSETLKAYEQDTQRNYSSETAEYVMQGSLTLAELCEPIQPQNVYRSDLSLTQQGYSLSASYDADSDPEALMTPEHAVQLWRGQGLKSHHSSGLSSPDQSALTLTDSENEHRTDDESDLQLTGFSLLHHE